MVPDWHLAEQSLKCVLIKGNNKNKPVTVLNKSQNLRCIGIGTDAAIFLHELLPSYAFKVYSPEALHKKAIEENVYLRLKDPKYFPQYFGSGDNYLVLSYEKGPTLYECLLQGIEIPSQVMNDVEKARAYARSKGLNPRDIHFKNVILQDGKGKVLDVSEYLKEGNDKRWEHLMFAYRLMYPLFKGKKIPHWVIKLTSFVYNRLVKLFFFAEGYSKQFAGYFSGRF